MMLGIMYQVVEVVGKIYLSNGLRILHQSDKVAESS